MPAIVASMNELIDSADTSRSSRSSCGSDVRPKAICIQNRHATFCPIRYASTADSSSPRRTRSRAMASGSGPRFAGTGSHGWLMLAAAQCSRFARLLRRVASASTGSPAMVRMYSDDRVARCISSSHSWGTLTMVSAPLRISSQIRSDGRSHSIVHCAPPRGDMGALCACSARRQTGTIDTMTATPQSQTGQSHIGADHIDVLIVGAGISGIGAAYYLQKQQPGKSYAILEARGATGGTWDLFSYPGIRSDSDLHTFGYEFKPWEDEDAIASADKILAYLRETVSENRIDRNIRFHHKVLGANWSSADARWYVDVERTDTGERTTISANWLFSAGGYYRYDEGFTPRFEGRESFRGQIVHPQHWPADLDYRGKRVVIIGSGATAVTLVPAMADDAAHVTMLQRSPSFIFSLPGEDRYARMIRRLLPEWAAHRLIRWKNI